MNCALPLKSAEEKKNAFVLPLRVEAATASIFLPLKIEKESGRFPFEMTESQDILSAIMQISILFHNLTINLTTVSGEILIEETNDIIFEVI
jgi:hypothetical protein